MIAVLLAGCGVDYVGLWDATSWTVDGETQGDAGFFEFRGGPYVETGADYLLRYGFADGAFTPLYHPRLIPLDYEPDAREQEWSLGGFEGTWQVDPEGPATLVLSVEAEGQSVELVLER